MPVPYPYSIGRLAKMAKLSVPVLRFYERKGLLRPLKRQANGYRVYDIGAYLRLETIKQLQRVGFSLAEMKEVFGDGKVLWRSPRMKAAMRRKLKEVRERIKELQLLEAGLQDWQARREDLERRAKARPKK